MSATLTSWEVAAVEICDTVEKASENLIRRAADDFYQKLLDTTQDYLRNNAEFNLASQLEAARHQAFADRETAKVALARVAELEAALRDTLCELTACAGQLAARGLKGREGDSVHRAQIRARAALSTTARCTEPSAHGGGA